MGGAFTPLLVVLLFQFVSWRVAFGIFGMVGVLWAIFFFRWFRDNPADNPKVNALELELMRGTEQLLGHGRIPLGKVCRFEAGVATLRAILLSIFWMVFLHHVVTDFS